MIQDVPRKSIAASILRVTAWLAAISLIILGARVLGNSDNSGLFIFVQAAAVWAVLWALAQITDASRASAHHLSKLRDELPERRM